MACNLHVDRIKTSDCTCANTPYGYAVERARIALHALHWPGSYGDHSECCDEIDRTLDAVRRMERNPNFKEGN